MKLKSCPACRKPISKTAVECPHCGHPLSFLNDSGLGAVVWLALIGGMIAASVWWNYYRR